MPRLATLLAAALVACALPLAASADADPASDVLYTNRIFLPFFGPKVSSARAKALKQVVDKAWSKGYKVKVALIGAPNDLGGVFKMFGQPQTYAEFLGQELVFLFRGTLVTVMPNGIGVFHYKKSVAREKRLLKAIPVARGTDGLAAAATTAVAKLAGLKAPPLPPPSGPSKSGSSSWTLIAILGGGGAVLLAMLVLGPVAVRRRRAAAS